MNKKVNLWLNISESILFYILVIIGIVFYAGGFKLNLLGQNLMIMGCFFLEALLIAVEIFMFYIEGKKYRFISVAYYLSTVIVLAISNIILPFYGIILLLVANTIKNIFRINKIEMICDLDQYYEFCDTFHIKVKKARGRRKSTKKATITKTKKQTTKAKAVSTTKKATTTKKKATSTTKKKPSTTAKKTSKSYA